MSNKDFTINGHFRSQKHSEIIDVKEKNGGKKENSPEILKRPRLNNSLLSGIGRGERIEMGMKKVRVLKKKNDGVGWGKYYKRKFKKWRNRDMKESKGKKEEK